MHKSSSKPSFFTSFVLTSFMLGLAACVPNDQLVITQEVVTETTKNMITGIDKAVNAISNPVTTAKDELIRDDNNTKDEEIVIASITKEEEALPPPSLDLNTLLGISMNELITRLGTEDYRRFDQDVLILQFRMPSCIVDFVMSSDSQVSSYHSRHRNSGQRYNDVSCQLDLTARDDGLQ